MQGLHHDAITSSAVPIPPSERDLQTVVAEPYFKVSDQSVVLEDAVVAISCLLMLEGEST